MHLIQRIFGINKSEWQTVVLLFLLILFFAISGAIGRSTAMTLLIDNYGEKLLPKMFVAVDICVMFGTFIYATLSSRIFSLQLLKVLLTGNILVIAIIGILMNGIIDNLSALFFCCFHFFYILIFIHLSSFVATYFHTSQLKRLISVIYASVPIGGALGGAIVVLAGNFIKAELIILIIPFFGILMSLLLIHLNQQISPMPEELNQHSSQQSMIERTLQQLKILSKSKIIIWMTISLILFVITSRILEYLYQGIIYPEHFTDSRDRAIFLGQYELVANLLALVLQLAFTGKILSKLGVATSNSIYPGLTTLISGILCIGFGFISGILAHFINQEMRNIIRTPSHNLLFSAIPEKHWAISKSWLNGLVYPLSTMIAATLIIVLQEHFKIDELSTILPIFILITSMTGILCSHYQGKAYRIGVFNQLKQHNDNESESPEKTIKRYIKSNNPTQQIIALKMIQTNPKQQYLHDTGILLIQSDHFEVKKQAAKTLSLIKQSNAALTYLIKALKFEQKPDVIEMILKTLSSFHQEKLGSSIERFLLHPWAGVFSQACLCLYRNDFFENKEKIQQLYLNRLKQSTPAQQKLLLSIFIPLNCQSNIQFIKDHMNSDNIHLRLESTKVYLKIHENNLDFFINELITMSGSAIENERLLATQALSNCRPTEDFEKITLLLNDNSSDVMHATIDLIRIHLAFYRDKLFQLLITNQINEIIRHELTRLLYSHLNSSEKQQLQYFTIQCMKQWMQLYSLYLVLKDCDAITIDEKQQINTCLLENQKENITITLIMISQISNKNQEFWKRLQRGLLSSNKKDLGNALEILSHTKKHALRTQLEAFFENIPEDLVSLNQLFYTLFKESLSSELKYNLNSFLNKDRKINLMTYYAKKMQSMTIKTRI
ncbi:MAG: hypothetical protein HON94_06975 [Methylococcales bacterium]|jgi:hypothetical protein|nr:hypothetical protein [Methylococcales bacterium]MBT7411201.1 hypothetical protein [Methylococcales bacterium]